MLIPIRLDNRIMDNVDIDENGAVWAASFPKAVDYLYHVMSDGVLPSPSTALRFTLNTGRSAFFGERFKIDRVSDSSSALYSRLIIAAGL